MDALTVLISLIGAGFLATRRNDPRAKVWSLGFACAGLFIACVGFLTFNPHVGGWQRVVDLPWIPSLGVRLRWGVDGASVVLQLLTGLVAVSGILFSWKIEKNAHLFHALFLALIAGVYGVFLAGDLVLLFLCYELAILPKYFLIAEWGSGPKHYAAMKLVLFSLVSSALVLFGIVAAGALGGAGIMDLTRPMAQALPASSQSWIYPLFLFGFGVLAGIWPLHTWAPTGHVAAPAPASMLLAGVVMKLGAYGCYRVALPLCPHGAELWSGVLAALGLAGIIYGGLVALKQTDFKFVIAFSSVSHMGFVMLGLATLTQRGVAGAVAQMFSHGVVGSVLFAIVASVIYERTHTRQFAELFDLRRRLPFAFGAFVVGAVASMGLPGFSGFIAEWQVLVGAWERNGLWVALGAAGVLVAFAYNLSALRRGFWTTPSLHDKPAHATDEVFPKGQWPEWVGILLLLGASAWMGLVPGPIHDRIYSSVKMILPDSTSPMSPVHSKTREVLP
jgi:NADH-quinone oxidoreductase subunit M